MNQIWPFHSAGIEANNEDQHDGSNSESLDEPRKQKANPLEKIVKLHYSK